MHCNQVIKYTEKHTFRSHYIIRRSRLPKVACVCAAGANERPRMCVIVLFDRSTAAICVCISMAWPIRGRECTPHIMRRIIIPPFLFTNYYYYSSIAYLLCILWFCVFNVHCVSALTSYFFSVFFASLFGCGNWVLLSYSFEIYSEIQYPSCTNIICCCCFLSFFLFFVNSGNEWRQQ